MTASTLARVAASGARDAARTEAVPARRDVEVSARASLPSRFGTFEIVSFAAADGADLAHVAIVAGDPSSCPDAVVTRVHSSCVTGDVLGSLRCDCGAQLDAALARIGSEGCGVVIYLDQEGRGIGLANKVRAYQLQDAGADTVEANVRLGFPADLRDFSVAGDMLRALGVTRVRLLTNNPEKVETLGRAGVEVMERLPIIADPSAHNARYLETKRTAMGHFLPGP